MRALLALALAAGCAAAAGVPAHAAPAARPVTAFAETPALFDDAAGGDADGDDPAIWVHPDVPGGSLIVATAKNGGLRVYDLSGRELQSIATPPPPGPGDEAGRFNNVDLVSGFRLGGRTVDLAVVTDRGRDQLRFYRIDPEAAAAGRAPLTDVTAAEVPFVFSADQAEVNGQATAYGLATWSDGGRAHAVVSRRSTTRLGLVEITARGGRVGYRLGGTVDLPDAFRLPDGSSWTPCGEPGEGPQVEGMVYDPATGALYAAQEDVALWRIRVDPAGTAFGRRSVVERVREYGVPATYDPATEECEVHYDRDPGYGGRIGADVEGVTVYETGRRSGHLLVSAQGDDTFFQYDRRTNAPTGQFTVADGPAADGVQESDGAAVTSAPLPGRPAGLLVVHDGANTPDVPGEDGEPRPNTNFKLIDARLLGLD
ncbi:phytase [Allonocardiopsis opalescens]|uniref:3-phytase n=1 Tax=Allonocardiopsis opalescens TaxID=1144618 RepID=A0A2T0QEX6_9ACTN|nr:phytase [Allonocardiopsis opalescens]PRY02487.1 3-phytase [Allonocardiopsis opalescens]